MPTETLQFENARLAQQLFNNDPRNLQSLEEHLGVKAVARDRSCFALLNRYPYNGGHLLVVPYKQAPDLNGLTDEEMADLFKLTRRCQNALTKIMQPDGFNIGINVGRAAGAGIVEHVHVHVVPRWSGDSNFMPVIANTTVLPEALTEVAARLRAALAS